MFPPCVLRLEYDVMKRLIILTLMLLSGAGSCWLHAQNTPDTEIRRMNIMLLEAVDRLENASAVSGSAHAAEFKSLFRDADVKIYNDLMGASSEPYIPLDEYVSYLKGMKDVQVSFSNVEKSRPFVSKGSLCVLVSFEKELSYRDPRNVLYSSEDFFGSPIRLEVLFAYDDFDGTCHIESIDGDLEGKAHVGAGDYLVYRPDDGLEDVRFRNSDVAPSKGFYDVEECGYLTYNSMGQTFLPVSAADEDWFYMQNVPSKWDPDVFISASAGKDGFLNLEMNKMRFRAKVYNSVAPAGAFQVDGDFDKVYSLSDEVGVEFRFMPNIGKRLNVGVFAAVGMSYSYLDLAIKDLSYEFEISKTKLGYDFDVIGQKFYSADAVVAGGLAVEFALSRRWVMGATLGAKAYYNVYSKVGDIYCDYLLSQESVEPVRFKGHFKESSIVNSVGYEPDVWPCPVSATASLGLEYGVTKSTFLTFGVEYEHGLNCYYQSELNSFKEYKAPVRYSASRKVDVAHRDFSDCFNLKRKALWLDLGVIFKF